MSAGPDFERCGQPVEWTDDVPIEDRFPSAIGLAYAQRGVDIELCRWSHDDPLTAQYVSWWNMQRLAIRRFEAQNPPPPDCRLVVSRRTDKGDGFAKCYVRTDRKRGRTGPPIRVVA